MSQNKTVSAWLLRSFTVSWLILAILFVCQQPVNGQPMDMRAVIAACYSRGATTRAAMAVCVGRDVSPQQFEYCMRGLQCFDAPVGVPADSNPQVQVTLNNNRTCGVAGGPPCPTAMPCGFRETIDCPVFGSYYGQVVQVSGAYGCGAVGYPPCRVPMPCDRVGTLLCAPPPAIYLPPAGTAFAVPQQMQQAALLPFEPNVQVVVPFTGASYYPLDIPPPGNFGESPAIPSGFGFNFGGDNRPPQEISSFQPESNLEFVPTAHPDLDRLQRCRATATTKDAFAACLVERAMPEEYRIARDCASAYPETVKAWLCSKDDPRLLAAYERVEAAAACARTARPGTDDLSVCLARKWLGGNERAIGACFNSSKSQDELRLCLGQTSLAANSNAYVQCALKENTGDGVATCLARTLHGERFPGLIACTEQNRLNPVAIAGCLAQPFASENERAMLTCLQQAPADVAAVTKCISAQAMGQKEIAYLECATSSRGNKAEWASCFGRHALGKTERAYLDCALQGTPDSSMGACVGRALIGSQREQAYLQCAVTANGSVEQLATCLGPYALGEREQAIMNCVAKEGRAAAACIANQYLGNEEQRIMQCALENKSELGATAVCALGPKFGLNPEMQIALTCAVASGGEPTTFATCAGGQLAAAEIGKCWQHGVGTAEGCYGPNNSIRKFFDGVDAELRSALGSNNALYQAYNAYHRNVLSPGRNHEFVKLINAGVNDLRNGPGPNNEIRKAATAVEKGFHKISKATRVKIKW